MIQTVGHFIDGETVTAANNQEFPIYNPATNKQIAKTHFATEPEINHAVERAAAAFPAWSQTPAIKRARILFKFKQLLEENSDKLADIVTREQGKTISDSHGSVQRGIELVEFASAIPSLLRGEYSENIASDVDCYTVRYPLGVCVGVSPFNFPVMVPVWMFVWAIACGNTFILKPSEQDPSAPLFLAELLHQAGLPAGVLQVLQGDKNTVDALITHPQVQAVSAVASTSVAKHIYQTAIAHGKRAHTFGGAKNHCVVMPDADIEQTAAAIMGAAFGSAGQRCMAVPVVVAVGDATGDKLVARLKQMAPELKLGVGSDAEVEMGPLISAAHREKVLACIEKGVNEGAELVVDGRDVAVPGFEQGNFLGACIFDKATPEMSVYKDEIFGPVLTIIRVQELAEAIQLASDHPYGNGTAIFTQNGSAARSFATQVQVGMVGINVPIPVPVAFHSFGGWKQSFFGDIAMHGEQSLQFYTKVKSITTRWPTVATVDPTYHMPSHH